MDRRVRAGVEALPEVRPSLRGFSHAASFFVSIPLGVALVMDADTGLGQVGASSQMNLISTAANAPLQTIASTTIRMSPCRMSRPTGVYVPAISP